MQHFCIPIGFLCIRNQNNENMKYYNGYPEEVEISYNGMSIDDVEHLILSLNGEDNIHPVIKISIRENYTRTRANYWDALFKMSEKEKRRMNELGERIIAQIEEMYALRDRLLAQELEKKKNGKRAAQSIEVETAIQDWHSEDATDEELDFYSGLFDFRPSMLRFDLLCKCYACIEEEGTWRAKPDRLEEKYTLPAEDGILQIVHEMKEDLNLAWKDMEKILGFEMRVKYGY